MQALAWPEQRCPSVRLSVTLRSVLYQDAQCLRHDFFNIGSTNILISGNIRFIRARAIYETGVCTN